jgi:hypothetical protein
MLSDALKGAIQKVLNILQGLHETIAITIWEVVLVLHASRFYYFRTSAGSGIFCGGVFLMGI